MSQHSKSQKNKSVTQSTIEKSFELSQTAKQNLNEQVNDCVRYFVIKSGGNGGCFRKIDLQKNVIPQAGRLIDDIINKSCTILREVYGLNLIVYDVGTRFYTVSNLLPTVDFHESENSGSSVKDNNNRNRLLLLLVLTHVFMSDCPVNEASVFSFLKSLKIEIDHKCAVFGNVKDYVLNTLVKQKFLQAETDPITKKMTFLWGVRAEKEISKCEILEFISKIYSDRKSNSWINQYKTASEQDFVNFRLTDQSNEIKSIN